MATVRGFQTKGARTVGLAVEAHAMGFQSSNDVRACCYDFRSNRRIAEAIARRNCVGQMQRCTVVRPDTRSDPALRQSAGTGQAKASRCHQQDRLGR